MYLSNRSAPTRVVRAALLGCLSWSCTSDRPAEPRGAPTLRRVGSALDIRGEPATLDFGLFEVGETASLQATIRNQGPDELTIREVLPPDPVQPFALRDPPRAPLVLAAGERLELVVTFAPETEGRFSAAVRIVFADPNAAPLDIPVSGTAAISTVPIGVPPSPCDDRLSDAAIVGTTGDDVLTGTAGDDIIIGLDGDDVIRGLEGNDVLCGGPGRDRLVGGPGDDRIDGGSDNDGGKYPAGDRGLFGGPGADVLWGGGGHDVLVGDDAAPRAGVHSNDRLFGGSGNDCLFGGAGGDLLAGGTGDDRIEGDAGADVISGDEGSDQLHGGSEDDLIAGGDGDDFLFGDDGNDEMFGGAGADVLEGGDGDDTLKGGDDGDFLYGEAGDDMLFGGDGQDIVEGGADDDFIDTGLLGAVRPIFDSEPNDKLVGETLDLDYGLESSTLPHASTARRWTFSAWP